MSVKRKYGLCWARTAKGGRLVRGIQEDEDIFVYVPDPEFNCVLQPPIFHPEKSFSVSDKFPQTVSGPFSRLPDDVVDNIILFLDCQSLDNLLIAIPMLADGVEQRYIRQVQLPCTIKTIPIPLLILSLFLLPILIPSLTSFLFPSQTPIPSLPPHKDQFEAHF